jgi:hypothetical protein
VNGLRARAAGAGRQCAPAALGGRPLNFTVRAHLQVLTEPQCLSPQGLIRVGT